MLILKYSKYLFSVFSLGFRFFFICLDLCLGVVDNFWLEVFVLFLEGVRYGRGYIRYRGEGCIKERIFRIFRIRIENFNFLGF